MLRNIFIAFAFLYSLACTSHKTTKQTLERFNSGSVPYISIDELKHGTNYILLDTREKEEFQISHLQDAIWVGFEKFKIEKIGEKLQKVGYSYVKNLYGGIFEWKNQVVDPLNRSTERIHTFSKHWSKLLTKGDKIYSLQKE